MKDSIFHKPEVSTPAYVYDQVRVVDVLDRLVALKDKTGCLPLYSIKSVNMVRLLDVIKPYISGFSCSSLFETKLAKETLDEGQSIHITTPGYRDDEWQDIIELSDFVTINSVTQWRRFAQQINADSSCGIRINPELSFVKDERYDPCRLDSKLGMTFDQIASENDKAELDWQSIEGIHIHNNCESSCFDELNQSVKQVMQGLSEYKPQLNWINLGGGYLFKDEVDLTPLEDTITWLQDEFGLDVYIEPGKAITGNSGYLVSTVIDLFESKNKKIVVLDTTINHLPEVFEYQFKPKVRQLSGQGKYEYRLVGCSCLSGDLFGDYSFDEPINIGSRIVFENIGAYMQVKANMFNGINLPTTYISDGENKLELIKQYDYESFRSRL